jgi:hemoglobin
MKNIFGSILAAGLALLALSTHAQSGATPATSTSSAASATSAVALPGGAGDTLYKAFGEKPGLARLVEDFHARLLADSRTGPHFKPVNAKNIKEQLTDQFCQVTGGPCEYKGADMKSAHSNLDITKSDFNALVEVLQLSMEAQGVGFRAQRQLLALLAPMHRDVITVK